MTTHTAAPLRNLDRFFIGGEWVKPSSSATIEVVEAATEETFFRIAEAQAPDVERAVGAARTAFDSGPWPRMTHEQRGKYLSRIASLLRDRVGDASEIWPRESGVLHRIARAGLGAIPDIYDFYAGLASTYPFEERAEPTRGGEFGLLVREPVGVVAAIIPWNSPMSMIAYKISPALLAGCTVVLKSSPEAPGAAYLIAEIAEAAGLPAGVLNVITADREVSELLVRDHRVDKISFTGSTAVGRKIAHICSDRIARYTLELGGKSAAVILDDFDVATAASTLAAAECYLTGQVCASLTRIVVSRHRHDELLEALAAQLREIRVGDPFDDTVQMGPLASRQQRERVEGYIAAGLADGGVLAAGGRRPDQLDRGWFIEPTVFGNVDNSWSIARDEIFGPVLSVIPADDEQDAINIANDSIYGLNAAVFTNDPDRALAAARQIRSGTVGHNAFRADFGIAFGGFKQSGVGREGGREGMAPYLETKTVILNGIPSSSRTTTD
ncbi:aldehyde dehydrogenase [Jatrophihabitans sp.]|uniref:aldehyde dehydrogenase n=1 Tax=Jatrophihabitans sp. TaxID=1932789 RepID=UPI0030C6A086|nr:Aldehyde Dehydrogenase [Jatrophihabitans sp.]